MLSAECVSRGGERGVDRAESRVCSGGGCGCVLWSPDHHRPYPDKHFSFCGPCIFDIKNKVVPWSQIDPELQPFKTGLWTCGRFLCARF